MTSLKEQMLDTAKHPHEIVLAICETLGIEERGGGPEGLYYTHPQIDGEFLYRNLPRLVEQIMLRG